MNRISLIVFLIAAGCPFLITSQSSQPENPRPGKASYYAKKFQGRRTANGEAFNNYDYTAAHRTLPFNTYLNIVNRDNSYNVIVRVNDRGPYAKNRVIDLSEAAARRIGGYHHGLVHVRLEVLNLLQLTPELTELYHAHPVVDCMGNEGTLRDVSLSLWSTHDLIHAIYVANDLYLKEPVDEVLIGIKDKNGIKKYHIIISGIKDKAAAAKMKDEFERKGFMTVKLYS
ncbi:MAG: septal ring lytic transglycosylase RlpA family protein [Bacteroidota bacterium]|nr:septal ring lytic transglycosylase RlpA family protein [Bacteroidota bacterium]